MSRPQNDRPRPALVVVGGVISFGALLGVWIALAGQPDEQDLVAGACTAATCVALGFLVSRRGRALPSFRKGDLRLLVRLPTQVIVETVQVLAMAARRPFAHREVGSWSTIPIDSPVLGAGGAAGWRAARRDSVLTALVSASPNTIVVEIDATAGTALIHTLVAKGPESRSSGG